MKEWLRLRSARRCGFCGEHVPAGEVMLAIGVARKLRCRTCAGEPPPEILPAVQSTPASPLDMTRLGLLAFDWKRRAVEREPGEED